MLKKTLAVKQWFIAICVIALCPLLKAQSVLESPLSYVAADSVVIWGEGYTDLRGVALTVDPTLVEQSLSPLRGNVKSAFKAWLRQTKKNFRLGNASNLNMSSPMLGASETADQAARLFLHTANGQCFDVIEHLLYNDFLHKAASHENGSFEKHIAAQSLVNGMGRIYATDTAGVWVNLYINSTTHIKTTHFNCIIDQLTAMPFSGKVKIRLTGFPHNGFRFKLRLRLPFWSRSNTFPASRYVFLTPAPKQPTVYVNGREPLELQTEGDYLVIDRQWNRGDEVMFTFPLQPRLLFDKTCKKNATNSVAITRGSLLYVVNDNYLTAEQQSIVPFFEESVNEDDIPILKGHFATPPTAETMQNTFTAIPYFFALSGRLWQRSR